MSASVTLIDQFSGNSLPVAVLDPVYFCTPVDKNSEGILNPTEHLTCYITDPPALVSGVFGFQNQFQEDSAFFGSSIALCVPTKMCGNGAIEAGEACDDGNTAAGDGCNATCQIEGCFQCSGQPSVCTCGGSCGACFNVGTCSDAGGSCQCVIP